MWGMVIGGKGCDVINHLHTLHPIPRPFIGHLFREWCVSITCG